MGDINYENSDRRRRGPSGGSARGDHEGAEIHHGHRL